MWLSDHAVAHLRDVVDLPDMTGTRYRIEEPIGRGGMGVVYRAHDEELGRDVALKVLRVPEINTDAAARMLREARILARLEHPGIVPVYDAGVLPDGRVFCAMKLVRGRRLDALATAPASRAPDSSLPLSERLRIFRRICEPVTFAHAHAVVHRDLKPSNIMLGEFGEVLVLDWGVAKADGVAAAQAPETEAGDATQNGTRIGTPGWMAPEQALGDADATDARADVHALGSILHFMLDDVQPLPRPLRAICARARAEHPGDRYADAGELAADIDRFTAGQPVLAHRETIVDRAARLFSRHRTAILLILTYLVMRVLLLAFA